MDESFERKVRNAEGQKKIFDNRVKYILFILAILTAGTALWDKCASLSRKSLTDIEARQADSLSKPEKSQPRKDPQALVSKRRHSRSTSPATPVNSNPQSGISPNEKKEEYHTPTTLRKTAAPIQIANSDNIEFKLLSAEGSIRAQTIKMTVILTTSAANWHVWSDVHSIIDPEGNEYKLKSFTNGASAYDSHIALNTDVPIKLTYTFGGILPNVRNIKLFKFEYEHKSLDDPISVEFRDIPIDWK